MSYCHRDREKDDSSGKYELIKKLNFCGAVEGLDFAKVCRILHIHMCTHAYTHTHHHHHVILFL